MTFPSKHGNEVWRAIIVLELFEEPSGSLKAGSVCLSDAVQRRHRDFTWPKTHDRTTSLVRRIDATNFAAAKALNPCPESAERGSGVRDRELAERGEEGRIE